MHLSSHYSGEDSDQVDVTLGDERDGSELGVQLRLRRSLDLTAGQVSDLVFRDALSLGLF